MKVHRLIFPTLAGLALAIALLFAAVRQSRAALDATPQPLAFALQSLTSPLQAGTPQAAIRYVATTGTDSGDCTDSAAPCRTLQYAVDQVFAGDEIRVAGGIYTGVQQREGVTQTVYISKTITIQGGYTLTNWITPEPDSNPSILDAQGLGRVVYISGTISTTLEGLRITGGDATGLGGFVLGSSNYDSGGGLYVNGASLDLQKCNISQNYAPDYGGGVSLFNSQAVIYNNNFYSNRSWEHGGGLSSIDGNIVLLSNFIRGNRADTGGGLFMLDGNADIHNNRFEYTLEGEAAYLDSVSYTINNNQFRNNRNNTYNGVTLHLQSSRGKIANNIFSNNSGSGVILASGTGLIESNLITKQTGTIIVATGILINTGSYTLTNNMVVQNNIDEFTGISIISATAVLIHNTIAQDSNQYHDLGVDISNGSLVNMTNNIIAAQQVGINVNSSTVNMEATLWGSGFWANDSDWSIANSTFSTGTVNVWGDPGFVDPDNGDYHIGHSSAAIDAGVEAGVYTDIDGEPRPRGVGFDIGADESSITRYVAMSGADSGDCADSTFPCRTIQYGIDQAFEGDEVRVAAGEYTDVHTRPRQDITTTGYVTQVVYISKTITVQGGYTLTNWINPNLDANPTILNALGLGRVVYITGMISPTISGLRITGGDATGMGGYTSPSGYSSDVGGGLYVITASALISDCEIYNSSSRVYGGGVALVSSSAYLTRNDITANTGGGVASFLGYNTIISNTFLNNTGGGLYLGGEYDIRTGNEVVIGNLFEGNTSYLGAGMLLWWAPRASISRNTFVNNTAVQGGGLYAYYSDADLTGNVITQNTADFGGGLYLLEYYGKMDANVISSNSAEVAGGFYLDGGAPTVSNNMIVNNQAIYHGSGFSIDRSHSGRFIHNTVARNTGSGVGVTVMSNSQITFTNTILVSQSIGIDVSPAPNGNAVFMEGTMWGSGIWANGQDWVGEDILTGTINIWGDPGFIDPDNGDYHIGFTSAAWDAGVDAGVYTDIDGEPRPVALGFDIGADELRAALNLELHALPNPVASGDYLTYSLLLTNIGAVDLNASITQSLPTQVTPGGILTWTAYLPAPGSTWSDTVVVTVDPGYNGPLTSTLQASSLEGTQGMITGTVLAIQPISTLAAVNDSPTALGQPTTFTATVNAGSHLIFSWDFGDGATASGAQVTHKYTSMGPYTATVTASNALSSQSADTTVLVEEAISRLSAANSSPTILGQPTAFTETIASGSNVIFTWDFGDGSRGSGSLVEHTYPANGTYTATVTASNAISIQSAQTGVVVEEAITGLSASTSSPTILGQPTAFTATIANGSNVIFTWDFGDGDTGQGPIVVHSYSSPGIFTATLTASNLVSHESVELPILITQPGHKIYLPLSMKSK